MQKKSTSVNSPPNGSVSQPSLKCGRTIKPKKSVQELISLFWNSPLEAFFSEDVIAAVTSRTKKTLQCDRWRGQGIPFRRCSGRVLYRKSDAIAWLEGYPLVASTTQIQGGAK